jgi:MFS family permease
MTAAINRGGRTMNRSPASEATTETVNRLPLVALYSANAISIIGNFMTLVALPWFVLETTGSAARTGLTAVAVTLPQVLAGFFANGLVDRLGYRRASILADLSAGATVALVPILYHSHRLAFWQLVLLVFCGNLLNAPGTTARQSMLPDLITLAAVPRARANAWYQSIFNFTFLIGPIIAGVLIPIVGTSNVLLLDAASFALSALAVGCFIPVVGTRSAQSGAPYLTQLREGIRFIGHDRLLCGMTLTSLVVSLVGPAFFNAILPLYARAEYGSPLALGLLRGGWGAGLLIGSLLYSLVADRLPRRVTYALAYAAGVAPFSLILFVPPVVVGAAAMLLSSAAMGPLQPLRLTIQQERTPEAMRSRVFGTSNAVMFLAAPAGTVLFSTMAQGQGVIFTIVMMWLIWIGIAIAVCVSPVFRLMDGSSARAERAVPAGQAVDGNVTPEAVAA